VSFAVDPGEIFGMIGPNGAGKTTTIRMLLDIIKPDSGEIRVFGKPLAEETKNRIGYLPEDRGLYRKRTVSQILRYFASLKGIEPRAAETHGEGLLARVDMLQHKDKKVEGLSRGMGQLVQFVCAIVHQPDLVILDEPFAGLDPVNAQLIKEMVFDLKREGKSIILSTHRMNEVEEMCDRIFMINKGGVILYGELWEIKSRYRSNSVLVAYDGILGELQGVLERRGHGSSVELLLDGKTSPQQVLSQLMDSEVKLHKFEISTPSLNEIFVQVVKDSDE